MPAIRTDLDAAMDAWDSRSEDRRRRRIRDGVFAASRSRALADRRTSALAKVRLTFRRDGLTVDELAERSTVSPRTIKRAEAHEPISDASWTRLARALDVPRGRIDPSYVP